MHNFRRRNRDSQPHAIGGFAHNPSNIRRPMHRPEPEHHPIRVAGFRSSGSRLDDFKRPDGLHAQGNVRASAPAQAFIPSKKDEAAQQASLLHMTLPSGGITAKEAKKAKRLAKGGRHSRWRAVRKWTLRSALVLV